VGFVTNQQDATIGWHVKFVLQGWFHASCVIFCVKVKEEQYKVMQELESCHWYCKPCVFNKEKERHSNYLENKNCTYSSECPEFEIYDIKTRLQKLNVTKSSGPDGIHPRILYETANKTNSLSTSVNSQLLQSILIFKCSDSNN